MKLKYHIMLGISITQMSICAHVLDTKKVAHMKEKEIPLTEDLMREHGALSRLLLIYEEVIKRMDHDEFPAKCLEQATTIIQDFIENYHEKLEEEYIFPLFEKSKKQVTIVKTLRSQHESGRIITKKLKETLGSSAVVDKKTQVINLLRKFIKMYRPHKAREDTVLFPLIRSLISEKKFEELSERFEDIEHEKFGGDGFFDIVKRVETIEKKLGIYRLN